MNATADEYKSQQIQHTTTPFQLNWYKYIDGYVFWVKNKNSPGNKSIALNIALSQTNEILSLAIIEAISSCSYRRIYVIRSSVNEPEKQYDI